MFAVGRRFKLNLDTIEDVVGIRTFFFGPTPLIPTLHVFGVTPATPSAAMIEACRGEVKSKLCVVALFPVGKSEKIECVNQICVIVLYKNKKI